MDRTQLISNVRSNLAGLGRGSLGVPILLLAMLAMMTLPIPPFLLDVLFTFNIALSIVVLLVCVYALRPLDFAVFPTILLVATLLRLEQMREASTHVAFVVNEFGEFIGLLTLTDILESIAGELPDASEIDGPDVVEENDGYLVSGAMNLSQVRRRVGFDARATEDYQTLAGLVMSLLDRLPVIGDRLQWQDWELRVV